MGLTRCDTVVTVNTVSTDWRERNVSAEPAKQSTHQRSDSGTDPEIHSGRRAETGRQTALGASACFGKRHYVYNLPKKGVYVAEKELSVPADPVLNALQQLKEQGVTKNELLAKIEELYREEDHAED